MSLRFNTRLHQTLYNKWHFLPSRGLQQLVYDSLTLPSFGVLQHADSYECWVITLCGSVTTSNPFHIENSGLINR